MGEEAAALGKALARLKALNEGLEAIAKAFGAASFNAEGARTLIAVAVQTKYDLLEELPPIHGVSFRASLKMSLGGRGGRSGCRRC
jgi:hypothetical protein